MDPSSPSTNERPYANGWWANLCLTAFGLQSRATVLVIALVIFVTTVLCTVAIDQAWNVVHLIERDHAVQKATMVSKILGGAFAENDPADLRNLLNQLLVDTYILRAEIHTPDGTLLASAARANVAAVTPRGDMRNDSTDDAPLLDDTHIAADRTFLIVNLPIREAAADAGKTAATPVTANVRLWISRSPTLAAFGKTANLIVALTVCCVLVSVPLAFMVVRRIVVPLNEMSRVARQFSTGDTTIRANINRGDEIGTLARSLNAMADEVVRKQTEIGQLNQDLERRVAERTKQLHELAAREPLTGLYNRRHLNEELTRRFAESSRYRTPLSMMMIDLDNFKNVNDRFGHSVGDQVLMLVAQTITSQLRAADIAARYGGDEFVVVLPHSSADHAAALANRITQRFRKNQSEQFPKCNVGLSIGIASFLGGDPDSVESLLHEADRALYDAKAQGKDRIVTAVA